MSFDKTKTDAEWRAELSPEQYRILREHGTERAFTGQYWDNHEAGDYRCAACGEPLFSSDAKFDSGTGWPSFYQALNADAVAEKSDTSHGMMRVEALCRRCGSRRSRPHRDALLHQFGLAQLPEKTGLKLAHL